MRREPKPVGKAKLARAVERVAEYTPTGERDEYPLPTHAVSVWLTNEHLCVGMSALGHGSRGHTVRIPIGRLYALPDVAAQSGWVALLELLKARRLCAARGVAAHIGTQASPVQYDLDKVLKSLGKTHAPRYDAQGKPSSCDAEDIGL